ncbi:MAG TPA: LD-carboxypeptidase [Cytophaga sp.]|jgi:muramoyltetrapeptide carboxypeptidase|nr:LD-carboxypeptidase [Cytophaga sp.]
MKQASRTIHIVAPAGAVNKTAVKKGIEYLQSLHFSFIEGSSLYAKDGYLAGIDSDRLSDLQSALDDTKSAAIWIARGGYGTTRIIDNIRWSKFLKNPRWIIGFSDITSLHIYLSNNNIPSIHGPMVAQASDPTQKIALDLVASILNNNLPSYSLYSDKNNKTGKAKGKITGGNLTLICSSLGTKSEIITDNKILFIEEINEAAYRIDRMLVQLKRAGKLKKLKGLIIGHMTNIAEEKEFGKSYIEIITDLVKEYSFPVCFQFPAGHETPNMPLILGMQSELVVDKNEVKLRYL